MDNLHGYSYPDKNHKISIYKIIKTKTGDIKQYIHPQETKLYAYVRNLSSFEQNSQEGVQDYATIEFVINYRDISIDMHIEFNDKDYAINSTDPMEFYKTELKLRAHPVSVPSYIETRWL